MTAFLVGCGSEDEAAPTPPPAETPLADAQREMWPLELGDKPHRARADAEIEKYTLAYRGIPIINLRFRVRSLPDGSKVALDSVHAPPNVEAEPRLKRDDVAKIVGNSYPDLPIVDIELAYQADADTELRALNLIWRVTLFRSGSHGSRLLEIDDHTGNLLRDDDASASATTIHGRGYYFRDATIEATEDPAAGVTCLRDPHVPADIMTPCGEVMLLSKERLGIATYFQTLDPSVLYPVATTNGILGNNKPPQTVSDWTGLTTDAVDAHIGAMHAIQFYRDAFGRTDIGTKHDSLTVYLDPTLEDNSMAEFPWGALRIGRRTNTLAASKAHPDILMHEYTHLLLFAEGIEFGGEARALHEGIADIFGILVQPTLANTGFAAIAAPPHPWGFPSTESSALVGHQRMFAHPSDDNESVDAYGDSSGGHSFQEIIGIDAHDAAGPVRRWFYFVANGAAPYQFGGENLTASIHLPNGMHGIGVEPATRILYRTITEAKMPTTTPTFREFRDAMLSHISELEQCSPNYVAVRDAWAAVNVGPAVDHIAPIVTGTVTQLDGSSVRVTVQASDSGDGLTSKNARILVNGTQVGVVALELVSNANGVMTYQGAMNIPLGFFTAFGFGPMAVSLSVRDFCGNEGSTVAANLTIDHTGAVITTFRDTTSTYAWTTNPDGTLRVSPFALSSPQRTFRVEATDPGRIRSVALDTPEQHTAWSVDAPAIAAYYPFDLSASNAASPLWLSVTDRYDNVTQRTLPAFVDRAGPACSMTCAQPTDTLTLSCNVEARDVESGVFAVRLRTIAPSPAIVPLGGALMLRRRGVLSLVADDWHWYFADVAHTDGVRPILHGPNQLFSTTLWTDPTFAPGSPSPLPTGNYSLALECRDFWGNTTQATATRTLSAPPVLALALGPMDNQGHYSFTLTATDPDGVLRFTAEVAIAPPNQSFGPWMSLTAAGCGSADNRPTTCEQTISAAAVPEQRVRIAVVAFDVHGASTRKTLQFTLPAPPPPPPPPSTVFNEHEPDCFTFSAGGTVNVVPANATEIVGTFDNEATVGSGCYGDAYLIPFTSGSVEFDMDHDADCNLYTANGSDNCVITFKTDGTNVLPIWYGFPNGALVHNPYDLAGVTGVIIWVWPHRASQSGRPYHIQIAR